MSEITLVEEQLVNDDGMWYGVHVTVHGTKEFWAANAALVKEYGEERVYESRSIIDQFRWSLAE